MALNASNRVLLGTQDALGVLGSGDSEMDGIQFLPLGAHAMGAFQKMALGAIYLGMSFSPTQGYCQCKAKGEERTP